MSREKVISLSKYVEQIKSRLADKEVPAKHAGNESNYKAFLESELKKTMRKVEDLKLILGGK